MRKFINKGGRKSTWDNIARWTYGINNLDKELDWSEIESLATDDWREEQLKSICAVNLKKISGSHTTDNIKLKEISLQDKELLKKQLALYDVDLIICCGTIVADLYSNHIFKEEEHNWSITSRGIRYYKKGNSCYVIRYAHPEARVNSCLLFYGLIDAVKEIYIKHLHG